MSRLLVVDDEADILKILYKELTQAGYQVVTAKTGKDSIEKAKETRPDLILMDVLLPDMNGADAVKTLHNYPELKKIPVIFLTAMVKPEEEENSALKINVNEEWYVTVAKPFDRGDLLSKIKEHLEK